MIVPKSAAASSSSANAPMPPLPPLPRELGPRTSSQAGLLSRNANNNNSSNNSELNANKNGGGTKKRKSQTHKRQKRKSQTRKRQKRKNQTHKRQQRKRKTLKTRKNWVTQSSQKQPLPPMRYLSQSAKRAELRSVLLFALTFSVFAILFLSFIYGISNNKDVSLDTSLDTSLTRQAMCQILCEKGVVHHHHLKQTRLNTCLSSTPNSPW